MPDAEFACPSCHRAFRWKQELAGRRAKCRCGTTINVPDQPEPRQPAEDLNYQLMDALEAGSGGEMATLQERLVDQAENSRYHDPNSLASDPGHLVLDRKRWLAFDPMVGQWWWQWLMFGWRTEARIREHLHYGDSRAAIVVSVDPLRVAAYTDEIDCVAMLAFPDKLVSEHRLKLGSRLLTVNSYTPGRGVAVDLDAGPGDTQQYCNVYPIIADFVCANPQRAEEMKKRISDREWSRCQQLSSAYVQKFGKLTRKGSPRLSGKPAFRMVLA